MQFDATSTAENPPDDRNLPAAGDIDIDVDDEQPVEATDPTMRLHRDDDDGDDATLWFAPDLLVGDISPALAAAAQDLLGPLYRQLVLVEADPLLRAAGNSLAALHAVQVLQQPQLLSAARAAAVDGSARSEFTALMQEYLPLQRELHKATQLHAQLRRIPRRAPRRSGEEPPW